MTNKTQDNRTQGPHRVLQPTGWARPVGYANGVEAKGRVIYVAGQIGWTSQHRFEASDLVAQVRQTLQNIIDVLAEAGARPEHVMTMTWYILDKKDYLAKTKEIGAAYRATMGRHFPAMAVVQVSGLVEDEALVEIQATAIVPE